jgi:hypothetical protein
MTPTAPKAAVPGATELSDSLACFRRALPIKRGCAAPENQQKPASQVARRVRISAGPLCVGRLTSMSRTTCRRLCELDPWHNHTAVAVDLRAGRVGRRWRSDHRPSVSPHFSLTLPLTSFQFPSTRFQSMRYPPGYESAPTLKRASGS